MFGQADNQTNRPLENMRSGLLPQCYCTINGLGKSRRLSPLSLRNIMIILTEHGSDSETNILDSQHGSLFEFLQKTFPCFINIDINFVLSSSCVWGDIPNYEQMKRQKNTITFWGSNALYTAQGRVAVPNQMNFRENSNGLWVPPPPLIFGKLYCNF